MAAGRSPIVVPSSELDAELHETAAEVAKSKHNLREVSIVPPTSDHGDDLMTPPSVLLEAALQKAESLNNQKESDAAVEQWVRCVALSHIVYGNSHWLLAKAYVQLARAYLELTGLPEQALLHAKSAHNMLLVSLVGQVKQTDNPEARLSLATAHWVMGTAHTQLASLSEAHKNLSEAKKYSRSLSRTSLPDIKLDLGIATSMGRLCVKQGKPSAAREHFEKALDLSKAMFGPKSSKLVPLLKEFASTELQCKGKKEAIELLQEALSITQQEQNSELTAQVLVALARAHAAGNADVDSGAVEDLLERASSLYHSLGSPALAISCRDELCHYLIENKSNHKQVIPMLKEIISAKKTEFGEYSQEVADTLHLLGTLCLTMADLEQARRYLLKARSVYGQTVGMKHKDAITVSQTLELISREPHNDHKSKPRFKI